MLALLSFGVATFVFAEQFGSSQQSNVASKSLTLVSDLTTKSFGSTAAGAWGNWGNNWNQIYSAATWTPSATATNSDVKATKTFYNSSRTLQTGQVAAVPTPTPGTPAAADGSRGNALYRALVISSIGAETSGTWGNFGAVRNRIYSASVWVPSSATAGVGDVLVGKTFYSGTDRIIKTGNAVADAGVCSITAECFTGATCTQFYQDADADGYGNAAVPTKRCGTTYTGYVTNSTDANDAQACASGANPAGSCNKCVNGAIANQTSAEDTFAECSGPSLNACSGATHFTEH